jgi:hypothetical protein
VYLSSFPTHPRRTTSRWLALLPTTSFRSAKTVGSPSRGTVSDALKKDKTLAKELAEGARAIKDDEKKIDAEEPDEVAKPADGKLILAEEIAEGHVSWDASERPIRISAFGAQ